MTALEFLRSERDKFIECCSLLDRGTGKPIPGTMDNAEMAVVMEYDAAIAEVEGMVEALTAWASAEAMVVGDDSTPGRDKRRAAKQEAKVRAHQMMRAALAKARP